jgi:hypothetical protein
MGQNEKLKVLKKLPNIFNRKPLQAKNADAVASLQIRLFNQRLALAHTYYMVFVNEKSNITEHPVVENVLSTARRLRDCGMEVFPKPNEQVIFLEELLEMASRMSALEEWRNPPQIESGPLHLQRIEEFRLETQLEMAKIKKTTGIKMNRPS